MSVRMHESNHLAHRQELVLLDDKNPRSIACLMPEAFAKQMAKLWASDDASQLLGLSEPALLKELARRDKSPAPIDHKLRVKFWIEYERVQADVPRMAKMNMLNILGLDFPKESFYRFYITDPCKLAFLLCTPTDYSKMIDAILMVSMSKILEVLESPGVFPNGVMDTSIVKKFMEINETMHRRKLQLEFRGGKPQRSGQTSAEQSPAQEETSSPSEPQTDEEKRAALEELRARLNKMPGQA